MSKQYAEQPGNYLAFFSSFDYLEQIYTQMESAQSDIPLWRQSAKMSETEKNAFLSKFQPGGKGIGFAVLGGAFGEGIDLPGDRLIGAFIATLGLPQINPVNQEMMRQMDKVLGNGYDYIYQYPGLQKVIQAAGRVIRTKDDRGTVHLMDDRFNQHKIRALLPRWWPL
jgi:Rad3-related DNA helicase